MTVIVLIAVPIGATLNYLFVHTFGLGMVGLAISGDINCLFLFVSLTLYCHFTSNAKITANLDEQQKLYSNYKIYKLCINIGKKNY